MNDSSEIIQVGWFDKLKASLNIDGIVEKIRESKGKIFEIAIYLGVGFLIGFLCKKYAQFVIVLIVFIIALVVLQQLEVIQITFDWMRLQDLLGIQSTITGSDSISFYFEWVKVNIWLVLSFAIGFFFGLRVG
jgi:uncharacterized membrane protein (Fun14 family)